jgi:hypothetical protein
LGNRVKESRAEAVTDAGHFQPDHDLTSSQAEAKFPLQAALGMTGSSSFLLAERNLVVEGVDDYWFITELSNLFGRSGEDALPEDVFVTAAGGASGRSRCLTVVISVRALSPENSIAETATK